MRLFGGDHASDASETHVTLMKLAPNQAPAYGAPNTRLGDQVGTVVFCHAHPDDEAIVTGCTMALAAKEGHRVVVVYATRG